MKMGGVRGRSESGGVHRLDISVRFKDICH